mmetsp:Transcript_23039/g.64826  ORF Transcript_23039/g.64826 Transcript_23039/m.64826 type:complete len:361 (-) Transcript_23039:80-1162(-)
MSGVHVPAPQLKPPCHLGANVALGIEAARPRPQGNHGHHHIWPVVKDLHRRHGSPQLVQRSDFLGGQGKLVNIEVALHVGWLRGGRDDCYTPIQTPSQGHLSNRHTMLPGDAHNDGVIQCNASIVAGARPSTSQCRVGLHLDGEGLRIVEQFLIVPAEVPLDLVDEGGADVVPWSQQMLQVPDVVVGHTNVTHEPRGLHSFHGPPCLQPRRHSVRAITSITRVRIRCVARVVHEQEVDVRGVQLTQPLPEQLRRPLCAHRARDLRGDENFASRDTRDLDAGSDSFVRPIFVSGVDVSKSQAQGFRNSAGTIRRAMCVSRAEGQHRHLHLSRCRRQRARKSHTECRMTCGESQTGHASYSE